MTPSLKLSDLQKDALKEVGNIGAGHAATALSQLLNTTVKLSEPSIDVIKFRDLSSRVGYENRIVAALHMYVRGEAPGQMVVLFDRENAQRTRQHHRRLVPHGADLAHRDQPLAIGADPLVRHDPGRVSHADVDLAGSGRLFDRIIVPRQGRGRLRPVHLDSGDRLAPAAAERLRRRLTSE
jgi:hypothetical protein